MYHLVSFFASFGATLFLTWYVRDVAVAKNWVFAPESGRHVHNSPVPRLGGVAIVLTFVGTTGLIVLISQLTNGRFGFPVQKWLGLLGPALLIFGVGLYDDFRNTSPYLKFAAQIGGVAWLFATSCLLRAYRSAKPRSCCTQSQLDKVKVLQVIPDLSPLTGGPVTALKALSRAQAALGVQTTIAATDHGIDQVPEIPGVTVRVFPCRWDRWRWSPGLTRYLRKQASNFDVVSIDSLWRHTTLSACRICRAIGVPYIIKTNGMLERWSLAQKNWKKRPYMRLIEHANLCSAAALHATSGMEVGGSSMQCWNSSVFVLPDGISRVATADPILFLDRFPDLVGRPKILFWGRLHYGKQPDVVITAFHLISQRYPEDVLLMAGPCEAHYIRNLKILVRDYGLGSRVVFTGFLPAEIGRSACRLATVFVLPSLQESFGVAIAEAMAEGCPVIVSDRVGIAPSIDRAGAGLVTSPTAEATAAAMSILLEDKFMRERMGQNGQRLVMEEFAAERVAAKLESVYTDILQGTRGSSCWVSDCTTDYFVPEFSAVQLRNSSP